MRVAIGTDHAGFVLKAPVMELVRALSHEPVDFGTWTPSPSTTRTSSRLRREPSHRATATGRSCWAEPEPEKRSSQTRSPAIRCVKATDPVVAHLGRLHNDCNPSGSVR